MQRHTIFAAERDIQPMIAHSLRATAVYAAYTAFVFRMKTVGTI